MKATIRTWPGFVMAVLAVVAVAIGLSSAFATTASAQSPPSALPAAPPSVAAPAAANPATEPTAEAPPPAQPTDQRGWAPRSLLAVGAVSSGLLLLGVGGFGLALRAKTLRQQPKSATVRGPAGRGPARSPRLVGAHSSRVYAVQLQLRHRGT